jgi:glycosyltransferase involved in cell wall biosynthesis
MTWSICIFAHNEERLLPNCVGALGDAAAGGTYAAHILENGSTDETTRVARALAAANKRVDIHEIAVGDKANAWNDYVHRLAPADADMHVFIDGDVRPSAGAFPSLAHALAGNPRAFAAAALPMTGRSRRRWATRLFRERYLSGNLYAIKGSTLRLFRERSLFLPVGAYGEDGLLSYIFVTDFKGGRDDSHRDRIAVAAGAFFEFDSLAPTPRDAETFRRRMLRYSQRYFQNMILYDRLKAGGIEAMPSHVHEIFTLENLARQRPRLTLRNYLMDRATLRRLRAEAARRGPHSSIDDGSSTNALKTPRNSAPTAPSTTR